MSSLKMDLNKIRFDIPTGRKMCEIKHERKKNPGGKPRSQVDGSQGKTEKKIKKKKERNVTVHCKEPHIGSRNRLYASTSLCCIKIVTLT